MDQPFDAGSRVQGLLERIEHDVGLQRVQHAPADDPAGKNIDDEGRPSSPRSAISSTADKAPLSFTRQAICFNPF